MVVGLELSFRAAFTRTCFQVDFNSKILLSQKHRKLILNF